MSLKYDFDIFSVVPEQVFADPKVGAMLKETGMSADMVSNKVALFRDPETAAALASAPEPVVALFRDSGFGTNVYDSGAPDGQFPARDEPARLHIMGKLNENLAKCDFSVCGTGAFNFADFLEHLLSATPAPDGAVPPLRSPPAASRSATNANRKSVNLPDLLMAAATVVGLAMLLSNAIG